MERDKREADAKSAASDGSDDSGNEMETAEDNAPSITNVKSELSPKSPSLSTPCKLLLSCCGRCLL